MDYPYNYLGPYRSDGKWQTSVAGGTAKPIDELDALAQTHDSMYAIYSDQAHLSDADFTFAAGAAALGPIGLLSAAAVGLQGAVRVAVAASGVADQPQGYLGQVNSTVYNPRGPMSQPAAPFDPTTVGAFTSNTPVGRGTGSNSDVSTPADALVYGLVPELNSNAPAYYPGYMWSGLRKRRKRARRYNKNIIQ